MTHLRFIYYVFGHYKMILLHILEPFVPFVEFLEIFCPSSKFWKSVAVRSGFGELLPFIPQQGFGILLQLRIEVHFNSSRLSGRNNQWSAGDSLSHLFSVSPLILIQAIIHHFLSLCLSLSLVLFLPLCFCLSSTLCFSLYLCLSLYLCNYLSLAHLFCVSLLILIPTPIRPVCPC